MTHFVRTRVRVRSIARVVSAVVVLVFAALTPATPAADRGTFFGTTPKLASDRLDRIRELLRRIDGECPKAEQKCAVASELYRAVWDGVDHDNVPVLVVYVNADLEVEANRLLWKNRVTPFVFGAQTLWVVVFSDRNSLFDVRLSNLWSERIDHPGGLGSVFVSSGRRTREDQEARTTVERLEFASLAADDSADLPLWVARESFYLETDTAYQVSITPRGATFDASRFEATEARFTNSKIRSVGFGIGIGVTGDIADEDLGSSEDLGGVRTKNGILAPYWLGHVYIKRPTLVRPIASRRGSRYRISYGITFGVNLDLLNLNQFVVGLNIGHLFGRHGVVIGANFVDALGDQGAPVTKPFVAVNFNF